MINDGMPLGEELAEVKVWGHPWHGLCTAGQLALPNSTSMTYPQPSGGDVHVLRVPGTPAVVRSEADVARDAAAGMQWLDHAILSGRNHQLYGQSLGPLSWIWSEQDGTRWLVSLEAPPVRQYVVTSSAVPTQQVLLLSGDASAESGLVTVHNSDNDDFPVLLVGTVINRTANSISLEFPLGVSVPAGSVVRAHSISFVSDTSVTVRIHRFGEFGGAQDEITRTIVLRPSATGSDEGVTVIGQPGVYQEYGFYESGFGWNFPGADLDIDAMTDHGDVAVLALVVSEIGLPTRAAVGWIKIALSRGQDGVVSVTATALLTRSQARSTSPVMGMVIQSGVPTPIRISLPAGLSDISQACDPTCCQPGEAHVSGAGDHVISVSIDGGLSCSASIHESQSSDATATWSCTQLPPDWTGPGVWECGGNKYTWPVDWTSTYSISFSGSIDAWFTASKSYSTSDSGTVNGAPDPVFASIDFGIPVLSPLYGVISSARLTQNIPSTVVDTSDIAFIIPVRLSNLLYGLVGFIVEFGSGVDAGKLRVKARRWMSGFDTVNLLPGQDIPFPVAPTLTAKVMTDIGRDAIRLVRSVMPYGSVQQGGVGASISDRPVSWV